MTVTPDPEAVVAGQRFVDATNAEDTDALLAAFADDAILDDWGRVFTGRDEIASWNARENIGTHNRIEVTGSRPAGDAIVLDVQVAGNGYNGGGSFTIHSHEGRISRLTIRG